MTVASTVSRVSYAGNASTTAFSFPYYFLKNADLIVIKKLIATGVETTLTLNTDYTVTGAGVAAGGTVTTIGSGSPLPATYLLTIYRDPAALQETDLVENDSLPAETVEKSLDRLTMIAQRLGNWISRTMKLSDGTPDNVFDPTLPVDLTLFPNAVPMVNDAGNGFAAAADWPTGQDIIDAEMWALLAEDWATKVDALVDSTDNSAKAYAIGGTGAGQPAGGDAKSWAIKTSSFVVTGQFSSKEWAVGVLNRGAANGGSSKDWSSYLGGTVDDTDYSSKKYANDSAASAASAAAAAASIMWNDVVFKTFSDSPITLSAADRGKMYAIDCTGGNVVVNLPLVSGLDLSSPFVVGIKKTDLVANHITINGYNAGDGTNQIDGANSKTIDTTNAGAALIPDLDTSPDSWTSADFGPSSSGGGAAIQWIESANAPASLIDNDNLVYQFEGGVDTSLFALIKVPSSYVAGRPIKLRSFFYSPDSSGNIGMNTDATLIRAGTDVMSTSGNVRTSTNTAVATGAGTVNKPQAVIYDLTDSVGKINSVAVSPGDLIKIRLYIGTQTTANPANVPVYGSEVTFT